MKDIVAMIDTHNVHATLELISNSGFQKAKQRIDHMIIKGFLAGILLSFGGLMLLTVGGGSMPLAQSFGPSIHKMIQAAVFPVGLIMIVTTGADLFTGNTMILVVSSLKGKTTWVDLIISWVVSYLGNLLGCIFFQFVLVYYAGLLADEPFRSFAISLAENKSKIQWHQLFLRGIGGNWLVCLAIWMGTSGRELHSKIMGIFLPILVFISVGYEHSIANMFTVQMGMLLGADLPVLKYILHILMPVTFGNILGGGLFVGFLYWYLYSSNELNVTIKETRKLSAGSAYQSVKQRDNVERSEQP